MRRAFLCGTDKYDGRCFDHRKQWLIDRIRLLSSVFTIDVAAYAIMSNHYHLVLHVNRAKAQSLSDYEINERWCRVFKGSKIVERYLAGDESLSELAHATLKEWRKRLFDLSWFMRCLNEHIARRANIEDDCTGRFWEGRFKSQPLLDEKALLAAMVYVDLNPIRAAMCKTVPESEFTSAYERIHGIACLGDSTPTLKPLMNFMSSNNEPNVIPCSYTEYLSLLDWSSRIVKGDKRGFVDANQPALLEQLAFNNVQWQILCTSLGKVTLGAIGTPSHIEHFYQSRGCKRRPRNDAIAQLFG